MNAQSLPYYGTEQLDTHLQSARALWILGAQDLPVPATCRPVVSTVLRVGDVATPWGVPWWLKPIIRRDRRAASPYTSETLGDEPLTWLGLIERLRLAPVPVITSLDRERSVALERQIGRPVHWLSIGGHGATSARGVWESWLAERTSFDVHLSRIEGGRVEELGRREFRISRDSPSLGHYEALRAAPALLIGAREGAGSSAKELRLVPAARHPSPIHVLARVARRFARNRLRVLHGKERWSIGAAPCAPDAFMRSQFSLPARGHFNWLESRARPDRFVADPFLLELEETPVLFFEEAKYGQFRGRLKAVELDGTGRARGPERVVLEQPYHLSFPNVFRAPDDPGTLYLLPEQADSGHTVLYRSPAGGRLADLRFTPHSVLLRDFAGIDPVLHFVAPCWYLFVSNGAFGSYDNNLHLFYASHLEGPYERHPASPIREGLYGSRMAGQLLVHEGQLFRLGQDCRRVYGEGIVIWRVEQLTISEYRETEVERIACVGSFARFQGIHSLTMTPSLIGIDLLRASTL